MTILDTFYLLFKSDAKGAQADVTALGKQIDQLAAKGKKISEDELKQLKELSKQRNELIKQIKEQGEQAKETGKAFVNLAEAAAGAVTAVVSFGAIKAGILDASRLNSSLEVQSKLLGQNAASMKAYGAAVESAGGSQQDFSGFMQSMFEQASSRKIALPSVDVLMRRIHDSVKGLPPELANQRFQAMDVPIGMRSIFMKSDADFDAAIASANSRTENDPDSFENARKIEQSLADSSQSLNNVFTTLSNQATPALINSFNALSSFLNHLAGRPDAAVGATLLTGGLFTSFSSRVAGSIAGAFGSGSIPTGIATVARAVNPFGKIAMLASLPLLAMDAGNAIGTALRDSGHGFDWSWNKGNRTRRQSGLDKKEAYNDWIAMGKTPGQAAALVGNEIGESGDGRLVGDGGRSIGIYQWSAKRRAKIFAGTGIDVTKASRSEQRRAANWEMQQMGLNIPDDPSAGAEYVVKNYLFPADPLADSIKRSRYAMQVAREQNSGILAGVNGASGGGNGASVAINGDIVIHTQATDAPGIASVVVGELKNQIRNAMSAYDNGIQK